MFSRENDSITIASKDLRPPARCPDKQKELDSLLKINNSGWTEPYRCTEDTEIVVAYVCPITETLRNRKQKTLGWISFELSLHFLNQLINGIKLGETGYVFMVSKEGTYISHPDQSKLYQNYFTDASKKVNKKDVIQIRNLVQI